MTKYLNAVYFTLFLMLANSVEDLSAKSHRV